MPNVFITGTFRNDWNRTFNLAFVTALETKGFSTYVPQRDSDQSGNRTRTFIEDVAGIDSCEMVIAIGSRTQTANWGFEIGYAFKSGKPVLILTDAEHLPDLMTEGAAAKLLIVTTLDQISDYLDDIELWIRTVQSSR